MVNNKTVKALGLCSGGLDSILSAFVLKKQGIDVTWITFETPFFSSKNAKQASDLYKIPLIVKDITKVYLKMLLNPNCGYGKNMNPCLDCHTLMVSLAKEIMEIESFDFLFSGEVLGQRPMSQTKNSLRYVENKSNALGYLLRPLSAKNLPETIPEKQGLVDRELLLDISGRSRKRQMQYAKEFKIFKYPSPAGGCLLTEQVFSRRLKDLFDHDKKYTKNDLHLLRLGRHIRLSDEIKVIIGRNEEDNDNIMKYYDANKDVMIQVLNYPGPIALITNYKSDEFLALASSICAGYSKAPKNEAVDVEVLTPDGKKNIQVLGISHKEFNGKIKIIT